MRDTDSGLKGGNITVHMVKLLVNSVHVLVGRHHILFDELMIASRGDAGVVDTFLVFVVDTDLCRDVLEAKAKGTVVRLFGFVKVFGGTA